MSERKNINKLFQENFENFEMHPDEMVWENIKTKLEEKKEKRRIPPFWWRLSGVAAALIIGFLVYHKESEILPNNGTTVAHQEKGSPKNSIAPTYTNSLEKKDVIADSNNEKSPVNTAASNGISNENSHLKYTSKSTKSNLKKDFEEVSKTDVATSDNNSNRKSNKKSILPASKKETTAVAYTASKEKKSGKKSSFSNPKNAIASAVNEKIKTRKSKAENSILNSILEKENIVSNTIPSEKDKSGVNPNIKTEFTLNPKIDSVKVKVASVVPNTLEELLKEKDSATTIAKAKINRWQLSSNLAPVYFSSITKGSPLDAKLDTNDKAYAANNTSYGLGVNYVINKKLKVRTGVNVLNVEYTTTGIVYFQNNSTSAIKLNNLNPNASGSLITIESSNNVRSPLNKISTKSEGSLNQKFGYIEMPLEITYKVLNKKFGIDVIGGMSTMVLNRNEIYLQSQDLNLKIGEANNLNPVHFSGNLGLGLKYGLLKNLDARIEPIIKYQWNTFSNDSGNFKPYIFGVYSGILYSF